MNSLHLLLLIALLLSACAPASTPAAEPPDTVVTSPATTDPGIGDTTIPPPYAPQPGDVNLERNPITVSEPAILLRESFPVQVALDLKGELPTPCHLLRVAINPKNTENEIQLDVYTVVNPQVNCTQVVKPFQQIVELGTFPGGHYTVWVNGTLIGEFDT
jgi:hypothetical protein